MLDTGLPRKYAACNSQRPMRPKLYIQAHTKQFISYGLMVKKSRGLMVYLLSGSGAFWDARGYVGRFANQAVLTAEYLT